MEVENKSLTGEKIEEKGMKSKMKGGTWELHHSKIFQTSNGVKLGYRVSTQRNAYAKGTLRQSRVECPEKVGFK